MNLIDKFHFFHRVYRYRYRTEKTQLNNLKYLDLDSQTVIDVGANKGIYVYWLAKKVGLKGSVIAFEPQPELIQEIRDICRWQNFTQVTTVSKGVSSKEGYLNLSRRNVGDGSATLEKKHHLITNHQSIQVPVVTLDSFFCSNKLKNLKFLKIDTEGHEYDVIKGGLNMIKTFKPFVQVEVSCPSSGNTHAIIEILKDIGYQGKVMLDGGQTPDIDYLNQIPSPKFGFKGHRDLFFYFLPGNKSG